MTFKLAGLIKMTPNVHKDSRGFFFESYHQPNYQRLGIAHTFLQDNHSQSVKHTVRGMHYQQAPGQAKLVRCAVGRIFDVAVDIRPNSPTFGQWEGVYLDDQSHEQLFVPEGFAHGFCVMSDVAHVLYKTSSVYDHGMERGFAYNDADVGITWPTTSPIISPRDAQAPKLREIAASLPQVTHP